MMIYINIEMIIISILLIINTELDFTLLISKIYLFTDFARNNSHQGQI